MEKRHIRRAFDRAADSYDQAAALQRQVCDALESSLPPGDGQLPAGFLLDAGCGTGYGAGLLAHRYPGRPLLLADFAPAMLARAREGDNGGLPLDNLPKEIVMSASDLVDAALTGFDRHELVTIPSLHAAEEWDAYDAARRVMTPHLSNSTVAARYAVTH